MRDPRNEANGLSPQDPLCSELQNPGLPRKVCLRDYSQNSVAQIVETSNLRFRNSILDQTHHFEIHFVDLRRHYIER